MSVAYPPSTHPIATRLKASGIGEIVVIDDAFDVPDLAHVADVDAFWRAVREDPEALEELKAIVDIKEAAEIEDDLIANLWDARGTRLAVHAAAHLFVQQFAQQRDVLALCAHLKDIGFEPDARGAKDASPVNARLVFLDYILDSRLSEKRDELSTKKAQAIFDAAPDGEKPFIVLMSDQDDVKDKAKQDEFRKKSKLIAGLFGFLAKSEVANRDVLFLRLGSWGIGNQAFGVLQDFVSSVLSAVEAAAAEFSEQVRELEVHDYSFIQKLSLHKDGHPLGDYLMWLFESALGHRLRDGDGVRVAQSKLDATTFDKIIPCQRVPSDRLARFYLSAVTEPAVSELQAQPYDKNGKVPLLFMGDIFFKDVATPVLMVITAACDLMFRPMDEPPSDDRQPIYLAPGTLVAIAAREPEHDRACTELILVEDSPYRIDWDTKHVESKRLGTVWDDLEKLGYKRKWRLRLPYALEVQQEFASHLTRVGLPVAPPLFQQADVEVFVAKGGKASLSGVRIEGGAALMKGDKGTEVVLTKTCVDDLMTRLDAIAAESVAAALDVPAGKYQQQNIDRHNNQAAKTRALKGETSTWLTLLEDPFKLPIQGVKGKVTVHQTLLWAYFETPLAGTDMGLQPTFSINITMKRDEVATAPPEVTKSPSGSSEHHESSASHDASNSAVAEKPSAPAHAVIADVSEAARLAPEHALGSPMPEELRIRLEEFKTKQE